MTQEECDDKSEEMVAHMEEAHYVAPGKCIADSGCTSIVMGEETWKEWIPLLKRKGIFERLSYERESRQFKFGNGNVLNSTRRVALPVMFYGESNELHISLVPGSIPLLLAKRQMADWGVVAFAWCKTGLV